MSCLLHELLYAAIPSIFHACMQELDKRPATYSNVSVCCSRSRTVCTPVLSVLPLRRPLLHGQANKPPYSASSIQPLNSHLSTRHTLCQPTSFTDLFHSPTLQLLFPLQEGPLVLVEERPSLHRVGGCGHSHPWSWSLACPKQRHPFRFVHTGRRRNDRRHPNSQIVPVRLYPRISCLQDTSTILVRGYHNRLPPTLPPYCRRVLSKGKMYRKKQKETRAPEIKSRRRRGEPSITAWMGFVKALKKRFKKRSSAGVRMYVHTEGILSSGLRTEIVRAVATLTRL